MNRKELNLMNPNAINTSSGSLVDETDLLDVLNQGRVRDAALDTFDIEPLPAQRSWTRTAWGQDGRIQAQYSPHIGYEEEDLMHAFCAETAENVER